MPKVIAKYSTTATNKTLSLQERIAPSKAVRARVSNIGARRKPYDPNHVPLIKRILTREEQQEVEDDFEEHIDERRELAKLTAQRSLLERLTTEPVAGPSTTPVPEPKPAFVPEIKQTPKELWFQKQYISHRIKETTPMFEAVYKRFQPLLDMLEEDQDDEEEGVDGIVDKQTREKIWEIYEDFLADKRAYKSKEGSKWDGPKWRQVIGAMKRFSKVDMRELKENYKHICKVIIKKNLTFDD